MTSELAGKPRHQDAGDGSAACLYPPQYTALVIDDDAFSRRTALKILERLGAGQVFEAEDGASATRLLVETGAQPDLILCDLRMPGMDGVETVRTLAAANVAAVFVLVSGTDARILRSARLAANDLGIRAVRTVEKPLTLAKLKEILEQTRPSGPPRAARDRKVHAPISGTAIWSGLAASEYVPFYQPKIDLRTRAVVGVEALVRWQRPGHGLIAPGTFLASIYEAGAIDALTETVLTAAAADCAGWRRGGLDLHVSVNLSVASLRSRDLPQRYAALAERQGLAPEHITFEVTEDGWLREPVAREVLTRLRLQGFGLSIDDFGTGFATLQQLLEAPFDELKIDKSFVRSAPADPEAAAAMASTISLARQLRLRVVGEGFETAAQWQALSDAGCDVGQGYAVARPMAAAAIPEWLQGWASRRPPVRTL